jgi:hypothetical protein
MRSFDILTGLSREALEDILSLGAHQALALKREGPARCPECSPWQPAGQLVVDDEPHLASVATVTRECGLCGRRVQYRLIGREMWEAI